MHTRSVTLVLATLLAACEPGDGGPGPTPLENFMVTVAPSDLTTAASPDVRPTVTLPSPRPWRGFEEFVERELPAWDENLLLVRWPSREPVAGRWVLADGFPQLTFTFEPESPLPEGWYATQIRFSGLPVERGTDASSPPVLAGTTPPNVGSTVVDGSTVARFHVGPRPVAIVWGTIARGGDGGGHIELSVSEEVRLAQRLETAELLQVTVNGVPLRCPPHAERLEPGDFLRLSWTCDEPAAEGEVVVTLRPIPGAPPELVYGSHTSPPSWRIRTGEFIDPYDVPNDLFTSTSERANP